MTKHQYYNPKVTKHSKFADQVKQTLETKDEWVKTPDLINELTLENKQGWKDWSQEWTKNILYSMKNQEVKPGWLQTKREEGSGNPHIYWKVAEQ